MKNTYRGEPEQKEDFSIEQFSLQVKRKALVFTSAGIACLIMTFSAYVIGMEEQYPTSSDTQKQVVSKEKSNISEHPVNDSKQLASADPSSQTSSSTENSGETPEISSDHQDDDQDETKPAPSPSPNANPPSLDQKDHDLSDIVAIADPVEESPVYEKGDPPQANDENPDPKPPKFEWNQPGFLDHLLPCKPKSSKKDESTNNQKQSSSEQHWIDLKPRLNDDEHSDIKKNNQHDEQNKHDQSDQQIDFKKEDSYHFKKRDKHLHFQPKNKHPHFTKKSSKYMKKDPALLKKDWIHKKSS